MRRPLWWLGLLMMLARPAFGQLPHNIPDFCAGSSGNVTGSVILTGTRDCVGISGSATIAGPFSASTIIVYPGGSLTLNPGAQLTIRDTPINTAVDPEQYGTGLLVFGALHVNGTPKTAFVRLATEPRAGHATLTVGEPIAGWAVGDRLVIPGTNQHWPASVDYVKQWETRTITAINGALVSLDAPLTFDHVGARDHTGAIRYLPHVGNLSRDIVIRSENPTGTRGHILIAGNARVDLHYARIQDMGRTTIAPVSATNIKGRYPIHLHMPESGAHLNAVGNVVEGSPKWGIFVHRANNNVVRDNVVVNVAGAGIGTEDGSETGNVFDHNFVVGVWGTGDDRADNRLGIQDYGFEGSPFWFRSPNNTITRNVAANSNSYAYSFFMIGGAGDAERTPFGVIDGNEAYGTFFGWTIWHYLARCGIDVFEGPAVPIRNTVLWHIGKFGYYGYCTNRLTFDGWTQLNRTDWLHNTHENPFGLYFGDYIARHTTLTRLELSGVRVGIFAPAKVGDVRDIYGNVPGTLTIAGGSMSTAGYAVALSTMYGVVGGGGALPPREVRVTDLAVPAGGIAAMVHDPDATNANWTVSDRLLLANVAGLTGEAYREIQRTQPFYGGLAPCATTHARILGLFCASDAPPPPPPPPPPDADGDGVADATDACPNTPTGAAVNASGCALSQLDSDKDGVNDALDACPGTAAGTKVDANGCPFPVVDDLLVTVERDGKTYRGRIPVVP